MSSPLQQFEQWAPLVALKSNAYAYPVFEVVHIIALAGVFGTLLVVDLRLLGRMRRLNLADLARSVLPWTVACFLLAAASGLAMFVMRISEMIANPMFIAKICLLFAAGTNAAVLHARGALDEFSTVTRLQAAVSLAIWMAIIFCGRWIAYI
jgi:hypothetical protein